MVIDIPSSYAPMCFRLEFMTKSPEVIYIAARDMNKPDTYYLRRTTEVNGKKTVDLKFPATPSHMQIVIFNMRKGNLPIGEDKSFTVKINDKPLPLYDIDITPETASFMKFALHFSENASILSSGDGQGPDIYKSNDGKFQIDYYNKIYDPKEGWLTTPARIGHTYGIVEVAKEYLLQYTVPMRYIILLHEFSHKYLNPKQGFEIDNEFAADINALYLYMCTGFSEMEALTAFATVFKEANSELNEKRSRLIFQFLDDFDKGEIASLKTSTLKKAA